MKTFSIAELNQVNASTLVTACITAWEANASDFGLGIIMNHLDSVRSFGKNLNLYQRNAQIVMSDSCHRIDELLEDSFK